MLSDFICNCLAVALCVRVSLLCFFSKDGVCIAREPCENLWVIIDDEPMALLDLVRSAAWSQRGRGGKGHRTAHTDTDTHRHRQIRTHRHRHRHRHRHTHTHTQHLAAGRSFLGLESRSTLCCGPPPTWCGRSWTRRPTSCLPSVHRTFLNARFSHAGMPSCSHHNASPKPSSQHDMAHNTQNASH